ncbi:glutathione S-transferase family protein [Kordiimonas aestuarii]|uniref:glutathione S-transferase family protein n=1 Tax=Kordiimonas aestuarii TaxID=1005925 RepID=UPI0021CF12E8|nr:glutathione S-transferase family protein [Kordiimonas aestuarii]
MQLVGISLSPYFERAVITLDVKGALDEVELALPPGPFGSPELKAANPTGKIPYLRLPDGEFIPEGQVIAEYFNETFEGPDLMPATALEAAKAKLVCRTIDLYVGPHTSSLARSITRGIRDEAAIKAAVEDGLPLGLDLIEGYLGGGDYVVGDAFSFADTALIPHMFHFLVFLKEFEVTVFEGRPKLAAWWDKHKESDIVVRSHKRMAAALEFLLKRIAAAKAQQAT